MSLHVLMGPCAYKKMSVLTNIFILKLIHTNPKRRTCILHFVEIRFISVFRSPRSINSSYFYLNVCLWFWSNEWEPNTLQNNFIFSRLYAFIWHTHLIGFVAKPVTHFITEQVMKGFLKMQIKSSFLFFCVLQKKNSCEDENNIDWVRIFLFFPPKIGP